MKSRKLRSEWSAVLAETYIDPIIDPTIDPDPITDPVAYVRIRIRAEREHHARSVEFPNATTDKLVRVYLTEDGYE